MLSGLDLAAYAPRLYVVAATDRMSETKARAFEAALADRGTEVLEREREGDGLGWRRAMETEPPWVKESGAERNLKGDGPQGPEPR